MYSASKSIWLHHNVINLQSYQRFNVKVDCLKLGLSMYCTVMFLAGDSKVCNLHTLNNYMPSFAISVATIPRQVFFDGNDIRLVRPYGDFLVSPVMKNQNADTFFNDILVQDRVIL